MNASYIIKEWPHKWYGLWKSGGHSPDDELPSISDAIDLSWNPEDKDSLVGYLRRSPGVYGAAYRASCLLCSTQPQLYYQSNNVWVWKGGLDHYVAEHHVVLPDALVELIRAWDYTPPARLEIEHWRLPWPDSWPGARTKPAPIPKPPH